MLNNDLSKVEIATTETISGIIAVLQENLLSNRELEATSSLEQKGFLVHSFSAVEIEAWLADPDNYIVMVCKEDQQVIGYTISCHIQKIKPELYSRFIQAVPQFAEIFTTKKALYYRHIAKKHNKSGIGKKLLQSLLDAAKNKSYELVICQILHEPFQNKVSLALHKKFGFTCVGAAQDGEMAYGIYLLQL